MFPSENLPRRECPVCAALQPKVLFQQKFATSEIGLLSGYEVVVCGRCGCSYADRIPSQAAFDEYYRDLSKYEYHQRSGVESEHDRRRLAATAEVVAKFVSFDHARVLDIGCATGRLLAELRSRGLKNVVGLDPSPACAQAAKRLYDIDVYTMPLAQLASADDQFDLVVMVGVLEHLRDLNKQLVGVRRLLKPGGSAYVEVPDVTAFDTWPNAPYQDFSTEHIAFFSPVSLNNLMSTHGFAPVFIEQNHREQSHKTVMSNISAVYRREPSASAGAIQFDHDSEPALLRYISHSQLENERLQRQIETLVQSQRPILVWGVGTHTARLMATSCLPDAQIIAFIESNTKYHGKVLCGRPILPPEALQTRAEPILISSRVFQDEIVQQIRTGLQCSNELLLLYES